MKKGIFFVGFFLVLSACAQHTSFLGPTYTIAKTGNIYQAGLTYESNKIIKRKTGKDVSGHLYEYLSKEKNKKTTREDLIKLVKERIENTRKKLNIDN